MSPSKHTLHRDSTGVAHRSAPVYKVFRPFTLSYIFTFNPIRSTEGGGGGGWVGTPKGFRL